MKNSLFERNGGTYTHVGDYLLPDMTITETNPIGKWGRMRKRYLQEQHPLVFSELLLSEKLWPHLLEILNVKWIVQQHIWFCGTGSIVLPPLFTVISGIESSIKEYPTGSMMKREQSAVFSDAHRSRFCPKLCTNPTRYDKNRINIHCA